MESETAAVAVMPPTGDPATGVARGGFGRVVHVVFRHGARGPSRNAVAALEGSAVPASWADAELERLTPHGLAQCAALGAYFGRALVAEENAAGQTKTPARVTWHSSPIDRTVESGKALLDALAATGALGETPPKFAAPDPAGDHDPKMLYRAFVEVQEYKDALARMRAGPVFEKAGKAAEDKLAAVQPSLMDLFDSWGQRINVTTYMEEILDCEAARDPDKPRLLTELNPPAVREHLADMAHWCWSKRFFEIEECKTLAEPLLTYIRSTFVDTEDPGPLHIYVHSAHDYSILLLLQQLGLPGYPSGPTLGYGGFLILGSNGKAALNARPFEGRGLDVKTHAAVSVPVPPAAATSYLQK